MKNYRLCDMRSIRELQEATAYLEKKISRYIRWMFRILISIFPTGVYSIGRLQNPEVVIGKVDIACITYVILASGVLAGLLARINYLLQNKEILDADLSHKLAMTRRGLE